MAEETIPAPFDPAQIAYIRRILSVAETDKPTWDPAAVYIYADGRGGRKQCTLSIGFTADGGNLTKVLERYVAAEGTYGARLAPHIAALKAGNPGTDPGFISLLKEIGKKDPLMMSVQEEMFDRLYLGPAFRWAEENGFTTPLSFLVIADSFLHSGSILMFLRQRFAEKVPAAGGNEREWIHEYLKARHAWLKDHSNKILRSTTYRANCFFEQIEKDNWMLANAPVVMHGTSVHPA